MRPVTPPKKIFSGKATNSLSPTHRVCCYLLEDGISVWSRQDAGAEDDSRMLGALQLLEEVGALQHGRKGIMALAQMLVRVGEIVLWAHKPDLCALQPCLANPASRRACSGMLRSSKKGRALLCFQQNSANCSRDQQHIRYMQNCHQAACRLSMMDHPQAQISGPG